MSEFTKVHCGISNGVILRLFEEVEGPLGTKWHIPSAAVQLNGGENDVDSKFFDKWIEVNSDDHLVQNKFIERID